MDPVSAANGASTAAGQHTSGGCPYPEEIQYALMSEIVEQRAADGRRPRRSRPVDARRRCDGRCLAGQLPTAQTPETRRRHRAGRSRVMGTALLSALSTWPSGPRARCCEAQLVGRVRCTSSQRWASALPGQICRANTNIGGFFPPPRPPGGRLPEPCREISIRENQPHRTATRLVGKSGGFSTAVQP